MAQCYVGSEIGQLRRVILHRPELSLQRLTPSNCDDLLFDDVLKVDKAGQEHDYFAQTLRSNNVEVFLLKDLLAETLTDEEAKQWTLDRQCSKYFLGPTLANDVHEYLDSLPATEVAEKLLGGITVDEYPSEHKTMLRAMKRQQEFIIPPLPNHLFTRDTSCWVYNGVSINPMAKQARKRETIHMRAIYQFHPIFKQQPFKFWYGNEGYYYDRATIEGGDVLVIGRGTVLIGLGERSTPQAAEILAKNLFKQDAAKHVIVIRLPKSRSCMHLDTVMTMLDYDCFTVFPEVIHEDVQCWELTKGNGAKVSLREVNEGLFKLLAKLLDVEKIRLIPTGGNIYQAEREQWNDANNVLTLRPGVVVGYERNNHTIAKFEEAGIQVFPIHGDELGRGRGGARCMSCPFDRDDI